MKEKSVTEIDIGEDLIHVVLASNRNYFCGLLVTLLSLLASNEGNTFCIHIIDGGLSARQKRILSKRNRERNSGNKIFFHNLDFKIFEGFRVDYGNSYMAYARIFMATFVNAERVIYLDTDLLVAANVRSLWKTDLNGCVVAAAKDQYIKFVKDDYPFEAGGDCEYFNTGVMVVDLTMWKKFRAQEKLLEMLTKSPEKFRWWDQTAMNVLFQGKVWFVDGAWNKFADGVDLGQADEGAIFHYVGQSKPWNKYLDADGFELWRAFFSRHVWSRIALFSDWQFTTSYLLFLRYRALCSSRFLKAVAIGALKSKALIKGRSANSDVISFLNRHATDPNEAERENTRQGKLQAYMNQRWSEVT